MRRFFFFVMIMMYACTLLFSQTAGNRRYVAVQTAALKTSTGFFARVVDNLPLGTEVTLIRENGKWSEVQTGTRTGWVASASLSVRRVVASNSAVTANEIALAGKGFSQNTEMEYKKNGLDYSMVDAMEGITIPADELSLFVTEGHLAGGE